jgi:ribonuclease BN (tRNA processing enzyme)
MLAADADLLIHDCQYSAQEYVGYVGWGHSSLRQSLDFATLSGSSTSCPFITTLPTPTPTSTA